MSSTAKVVFFDPLRTLGFEIAESRTKRFQRFHVYPSARRLVSQLRERVRIGVFALDPVITAEQLREVLASTQLDPLVDLELVAVADPQRESPFADLKSATGLSGDEIVFVSLDASHRTRALEEELRVAPHPALAAAVVEGQRLSLVRISSRRRHLEPEWARLLEGHAAVPVLRIREPEPVLYAIAASAAFDALSHARFEKTFEIKELGGHDAVAGTSLVMLQITQEQVKKDEKLRAFVNGLPERPGVRLVHAMPSGRLIALSGNRTTDAVHPPPAGGGHGHTLALTPDTTITAVSPVRRAEIRARKLSTDERDRIMQLDANAFKGGLEALRVEV